MKKRHILYILFFIVTFFVFDQIIGFTCNKLLSISKSKSLGKELFILNKDSSDLFVFGSSRAEYHYNTLILRDSCAVSTFNAGKSGNGIYYSYMLFSALLNRFHPKYVILDVTESDIYGIGTNGFSLQGVINTAKIHYFTNVIIRNFIDVRTNCFDKISIYINAYRYNSQLLNLLNAAFRESTIIDDLGFKGLSKKNYNVSINKSDNIDLNEDKLRTLEDFLILGKKNNIKMLLIYSPSAIILNDTAISIFNEISKKHEVPFLNFSKDSMSIKEYDFSDNTHLSIEGANKFTHDIVPYIKNMINEK